MNPDTKITFEPIYANRTSWRLKANGIEIACASVRGMGAVGGVYWFKVKQSLVEFKEAQELFKAHFAGDGACKFRGDTGICSEIGSGNEGKHCVPCDCYAPRVEAEKVLNIPEPKKETERN